MTNAASADNAAVSGTLRAPRPGERVELGGSFRDLRLADFAQVRSMVDCRNFLGESPIWQPLDASVWWIDIFAPAIYRLDVRTGAVAHQPLPKRAAAVVPHRDGGVLVVLRSALMRLEAIDGEPRLLKVDDFELDQFRFNDAKVDARGRLWVGTFDPSFKSRDGTLRCIAGSPLRMSAPLDRGIGLANGIGWSPDGRTLYFTDSLAKTIYAYEFDAEAASASRRRVFVAAPPSVTTSDASVGDEGHDGLAVDCNGNVWSAQFGRWCIDCHAPDGRLVRSVRVPTQHPTSCIFGGEDLATLYVTTATMGLTADELAAQPCAGSLLTLDVGAAGTPVGSFEGE